MGASIVCSKIIGLFKVNNGSKINEENYILYQMFFELYRSPPRRFKLKSIFMTDNSLSYSAKLTVAHFSKKKKNKVSKTAN